MLFILPSPISIRNTRCERLYVYCQWTGLLRLFLCWPRPGYSVRVCSACLCSGVVSRKPAGIYRGYSYIFVVYFFLHKKCLCTNEQLKNQNIIIGVSLSGFRASTHFSHTSLRNHFWVVEPANDEIVFVKKSISIIKKPWSKRAINSIISVPTREIYFFFYLFIALSN